MGRNDRAGKRWYCRVKRNASNRIHYHRNAAAGLCVKCSEVAVTGTLCFDCASKRDELNLTRIQ